MTPHHEYTTVLNKQGWLLILDFVETDKITSKPDDFIEELELRPYHDAVRNIYETFGLPLVGDMIYPAGEFGPIEIIGRYFDYGKKTITLTVF